jgi:hypothetical protein
MRTSGWIALDAGFVCLAALALPTAAAAGPLEDLEPGHWYQVAGSTLAALDPCPALDCSYSANEGQAAVIDDWNGGAFAAGYGNKGGLVVFGGGHSGYFGNEVYVFDVAELAWTRFTEPVEDPVCDYAEAELQDGSPCSSHTYDGVDYHPGSNSFVILAAAGSHEGITSSGRTHLLDLGSGAWRRGDFYPGNTAGMYGATAYDPMRDAFWMWPGFNQVVGKYEPTANGGEGKWTTFDAYNIDTGHLAAVDPTRDLAAVLDGLGQHRVVVFDLQDPANGIDVATEGGDAAMGSPGHGFDWDPVAEVFVAWIGGTSVHTLTPPDGDWKTGTWKWTEVPAAAANAVTPSEPNGNGTWSRWRYVPSVNAWVVVNRTGDDVFFYKLSDGAGTGENPASGAGGVGSGGAGVGGSPIGGGGAPDATGAGAAGDGDPLGEAPGDDGAASGGCACRLGASPTRAPAGGALLALLLAALLTRRRHARRERRSRARLVLPVSMALGALGCGGDDAPAGTGPTGGTGATSGSGGAATSSGGNGSAASSAGGSGAGAAASAGSGGAGPATNFATRCAAPGVLRCVGFDAPDDIAGEWGIDPTGTMPGDAVPSLDTSVKASGASSLKFTVPSLSGPNTSGSYFANFSDDLSVQLDSGDEFYVQWRQRFGTDFLTSEYAGGGGWKQVIIGEGSRPGDPVSSCTPLELVTFNPYHLGFAELYHSCGAKDDQYEPITPPLDGADFALQNAVAGCTYQNATAPPCFGYQPEAWMTFQVHVKIGTWYQNDGNYQHDSVVQLWIAREGEPSQLVVDMSPGDAACAAEQTSLPQCKTGYDLANLEIGVARYGQVWLLPYNTGKDPSVAYPETATHYDELIVSRDPIADAAP